MIDVEVAVVGGIAKKKRKKKKDRFSMNIHEKCYYNSGQRGKSEVEKQAQKKLQKKRGN